MTTDSRYPAAFRAAHTLIYEYSRAIAGIFPGIETRRLPTCLGTRSGCESPYCPSCSKRRFFKLEKRLWKVASRLDPSELRYLTFLVADCSDFELRSTAKGVKAVAIQMLKDNPSLQGWFMRLEVTPTPKRPGMFHPHIHVLAHFKPESLSGGNSVSLRKWQTAWKSRLPEDARTRKKPVVIDPVDELDRAAGYICKSPWYRAGRQGPRRIHSYAIHMLDMIAAMAHLPSYKSSGTLDVS
jgi:hypothetical protein